MPPRPAPDVSVQMTSRQETPVTMPMPMPMPMTMTMTMTLAAAGRLVSLASSPPAARMTTNCAQGPMGHVQHITGEQPDAYTLVSAILAGTYRAQPKIIQPVRKPAVRPSPQLSQVYAQPADGSRRANPPALIAQH